MASAPSHRRNKVNPHRTHQRRDVLAEVFSSVSLQETGSNLPSPSVERMFLPNEQGVVRLDFHHKPFTHNWRTCCPMNVPCPDRRPSRLSFWLGGVGTGWWVQRGRGHRVQRTAEGGGNWHPNMACPHPRVSTAFPPPLNLSPIPVPW